MSEENKAVIRRLVDGFWNEGKAEVIDEVYAADFVHHNPPPGSLSTREAIKEFSVSFRAAFSEIHTTVDDMIAEGDKVVWRWTFRGTHTGHFMEIPATGKQVTLKGIDIDRFSSGSITERWDQADFLSLLQQLGVVPTQ